MTYTAAAKPAPQISFASQGGSETAVPDISIELDLEAVHRRAVEAGCTIEYGPVREPWGVERLYVRDPFGRLVNVLAHELDAHSDPDQRRRQPRPWGASIDPV